MMPKDWTIGSLGDLADTVMGFAFKSTHFTPSGVPLLRMGNLYQNTLDFERSPVFLPTMYKYEYKRFVVKPGDLVMSMTGTMGKRDYGFTVEIPKNASESLLNQRVMKFVPKDKTSAGFLLNLLRSEIILSRLYSFPGGTKQANLSAKQVQDLPAPIPPLPEQKKIAQILSTWDKAITTTEQLLANSQQQKKALMQQLLTGKKRLLDKNGVRFRGEWKATEIRRLLNESRVASVGNDPSSRLTVKLNLKGVEQREVRGTEAVDSTAHFVRSAGQFIYGKQNIHKGAFGIIPYALDGFETSQDLPAFDFTGVCDPSWFLHYMSRCCFYSSLENKMSGTGSKRLNPKVFFKVNVLLPSVEEQKKIATVLSTADQEITTLQQKLDALKQEKKALMQQLLTGKRRVKVDAKEA